MPRPDWITYFASMATLVSTRATCPRKSVGAVLVSADHRIVSTGYNGSPKGMPHCTDEGVGCLLKEIDGKESCIRTLHAESNALDFAGQTAEGCRLYTTVIPCFDCAKRIVHAGVTTVYFAEWYESRNTNLVEAYFESSRTNLVRL
jgi:dCMP deaminase